MSAAVAPDHMVGWQGPLPLFNGFRRPRMQHFFGTKTTSRARMRTCGGRGDNQPPPSFWRAPNVTTHHVQRSVGLPQLDMQVLTAASAWCTFTPRTVSASERWNPPNRPHRFGQLRDNAAHAQRDNPDAFGGAVVGNPYLTIKLSGAAAAVAV
jgi:hypothetical protein